MTLSAAKFMCALFTTIAVSLLHGPAVAQQQRQRLIVAKVNSKALEGNLAEDSPVRNVTIYLPPGYYTHLQQKYPVVYLLHGYTGNNLLWTGKGYCGEELNMAQTADELIAKGQMRPMILVAPDCSNEYRGSWYTNSLVTGGWEDFVTKELVQYVDDNYRTLAITKSRGIAGHSMGGHGALKLAMRRPEVYGAVYALSPAFPIFHESIVKRLKSNVLKALTLKKWDDFEGLGEDWLTQAVMAAAVAVAPNPNKPPFYADFPLDPNGEVVEKAWRRWQKHDLFTMIGTERYQDNLRRLRGLRIDCGRGDTRLIAEDGRLSKALHDAEVPHVFEEYDGDHINRVAERLRDKVLPFFSGTLTFDDADSAQVMQGSPPPAGGLVTWQNWETSHAKQRWAMQHFRELFPTQAVTRGEAQVQVLERQPRDIMQVRFEQHDGQEITIATALRRLEVDAFVVLHGGKIVNETYFHGMRRSTPHFLLSVHKSIVSTVIATLIGDGLLAYDQTVDTYVHELKNSAHAGTTVRQALDMLSAVEYSYLPNGVQKSTFAAHKEAVHPGAPYLNVPVGSQEFVMQLSKRDCEHGECMHYKESDPAILIWAAERVTGKRFASLVEERLWSTIGAEFAIETVCDPRGFWTHYVSATAVDLARWGQMIVEGGCSNGQLVVPPAFIKDVRERASIDLLQAEPFVGAYLSDGIGYRSFFYVDSHRKRAIAALGGYGQLCYFSPEDETVIIILSSPPPTEVRVSKGIDPKVVARTEKGEELDRWNLCRKLCAHLANQQ